MATQNHDFDPGDQLPAYILDALQEWLSGLVSELYLIKSDNTHLRVTAASGERAAVVVDGAWRYNDANVTAAHPGGAAGTYDVYVTASAEDIDNDPIPFTDITDYSFGLVIVAEAGTPSGPPDHYRKIGTCEWTGAKIINVTQTAGRVTPEMSGSGFGPLADRPAASAVPVNATYYATDVNSYTVSDGSSWLPALPPDGAITLAKLAAIGMIQDPAVAQKLKLIHFQDGPTLGTGYNASGFDLGVKFPDTCLHVWSDIKWYADAGRTTLVNNGGAWVHYRPGTGGSKNHILFDAVGRPDIYVYPMCEVFAIGY